MKACHDLTELMEETAKVNFLVRAMTGSATVADAVLP